MELWRTRPPRWAACLLLSFLLCAAALLLLRQQPLPGLPARLRQPEQLGPGNSVSPPPPARPGPGSNASSPPRVRPGPGSNASSPPRVRGKVRVSKQCPGIVEDPPRVHWMVKTSPTLCTAAGRCGEVQATWAARPLCYNQTVSFMDAGPGRPQGLREHPCYEYLEYTGAHDKSLLGLKEMWQWQRVVELHPDVDWIAAADDDTFFLVDNILNYLKTLDPEKPVVLGRRFKLDDGVTFHSGGAGFIISRAGFRQARRFLEECSKKWPWEPGDTCGGRCWKLAGLELPDTRDSHGRERFHPFNYDTHHNMVAPTDNKDWYFRYSTRIAPLHEGRDCCGANETLSFHYMAGAMRGFWWPRP